MEDEQNREKMIQETLRYVDELERAARALEQEVTISEKSEISTQMRMLAEKVGAAVADVRKIID